MYFTLYKDSAGEWRWNLRSANHKTIADSGEGYKSKQGAEHGIALMKAGVAAAKIWNAETKAWE